MIWQQPWAWAGAAAVLLPVFIHLLGLGRTPRYRFPTLRFIQSSRLLPTRRTRLHDPWLLLLRAVIVLAAVAALAQPLLQTAERRARFAVSLARVVILDTSASARDVAVRAGWGTDSARVLSQAYADSADVSRLLETADVEAALPGAAHWLRTQARRREIVVLSDFQISGFDGAALRDVPREIGLLPVRLGAFGNEERAVFVPDSARGTPELLTASESVGIARAAVDAARRVAARSMSAGESARLERLRDVAIVSGDYPGRDSVLAGSVPLQTAWMIRLLHDVRSHSLLAGAYDVRAMQGARDGQSVLLLLMPGDATPSAWLSVAAALYDAMPHIDEQGSSVSRAAALIEMESSTFPDSTLRGWRRAPATEPVLSDLQRALAAEGAPDAVPRGVIGAASDARWLWAFVLVLLGVESVMRGRLTRRATAPAEGEVAPDSASDVARSGARVA